MDTARNRVLPKDKVGDDYRVLANLWEDLFDLFVKELWAVVDKAKQDGTAAGDVRRIVISATAITHFVASTLTRHSCLRKTAQRWRRKEEMWSL